MERAKSGATERGGCEGGRGSKWARGDKFANMSEEEIEKYKAEEWDDWMSLEGGTCQRNAAQQKYVGKDGLTDRERRQLTRYKQEIEEITERWTAAGAPTFDLSDDERMVRKLWRGDLSMSEELIELKATLAQTAGVEGRVE